MDYEEQTLSKLYKVFLDGYRPSRLKQTYYKMLKSKGREMMPAYIMNCVAHAFFNPTNAVLTDYGFTVKDDVFGKFSPYGGATCAISKILHFVKDTGLKVEECDRKKPIETFNSWKVDAFYRNLYTDPDYHFMLQETRGIYSHKVGFDSDVTIMLGSAIDEYRNYDYYGTFLITNPNADPDNKYNRPLSDHNSKNLL